MGQQDYFQSFDVSHQNQHTQTYGGYILDRIYVGYILDRIYVRLCCNKCSFLYGKSMFVG